MNRGIAILAHVLLAVGLVGEALTIALAAPHDRDLVTWRLPDVLLAVLTVVSGWILAWKRPRIPIGWLLLSVGLIEAPSGPLATLGLQLVRTDPTASGWATTFGAESQWTWIPALGILVTQLPLYFLSGRLPSRRWRPFAVYTVVALLIAAVMAASVGRTLSSGVPNPTYIHWPGGDAVPTTVLGLLLGSAAIGSIASVFVRYRRAGALERTQLRWLFWAVAIIVGWLVLELPENALFGSDDAPGVGGIVANILDVVAGLTYSLVPIAWLIGVLRYGLYSIDRILSRTASYAIVSLTVVVGYGGIVVFASLLKLPSVGVALATLLAAAVFLPLLRIVRRVIDRRFNRAQYDAEKVVESFGERVRNGADPHTASADLVGAVTQTLQPAAIGLWTRDDPR